MSAINFGEIRDLHVRNGEPQLTPRPTVVRSLRLGAGNTPRSETGASDFMVKAQVLELLDELCRLGNGLVSRIGIKAGLPVDVTVIGGFFDEVSP
jgi:hypothetical protein